MKWFQLIRQILLISILKLVKDPSGLEGEAINKLLRAPSYFSLPLKLLRSSHQWFIDRSDAGIWQPIRVGVFTQIYGINHHFQVQLFGVLIE